MNPTTTKSHNVLMLLTNAFDPDPRVHQEAMALVNAGYEVTILCWDRDFKSSPFDDIDGVKVERIYVRSTHGRGTTQMFFLFLFWFRAFIRSIRKPFDVVHCHDFDTLPLGFALAKRRKAKLVYDAHESYIDMLGNIPGWIRALIHKAENFLLRRTDLLITVGEILRIHLAQRGATKTCIVGNWKDPAKFEFPADVIRKEKERLKIADTQLVVSFIANLGDERQLPQLIEAVEDTPDVFLIVGGDGPARNLVQLAADKCPNICFLSYVHPSKVPFYTVLSDVIFYGFDPSNPNARFSAPNKLFEAIAARKAIITGDFGEIARIVREEKCGIILENYSVDRIKETFSLLNSGALKRYMKNSYNASLNKYSWDIASRSLLDNYKGIIQ